MRQNSPVSYRLALASFLVGLAGVAVTAGCADNQIGRLCNDPSLNTGGKPASGLSIVAPAPDCPSRLCLTTPGPTTATATRTAGTLSVCSAECATDSDCETAGDYKSASSCTKYTCAYPSIIPTDNFCCKKICMCDADIPAFAKNPPAGKMLQRDPDGVLQPDRCRQADACVLPK